MYPPTPAAYRNKLILITAVITLVVTSVAWIGIGAAGYWMMYREPPSFQIDVDCPEMVELGEEFDLKVSVENTGADDVSLANVDFYDELLDGFEVINVTPKPRSSEKIIGYRSYNIHKRIAPAKKHEVTFKLKAKELGFWSGDIDACNISQNMVTYYTEIEVIDPPAVKATTEE